jgi:hypothetical protein
MLTKQDTRGREPAMLDPLMTSVVTLPGSLGHRHAAHGGPTVVEMAVGKDIQAQGQHRAGAGRRVGCAKMQMKVLWTSVRDGIWARRESRHT